MATNTRDIFRDELASLLSAALVGTGKPVTAVYNYFKGHLGGESPVLLVTSGSMQRSIAGQGTEKYEIKAGLNVIVCVADANSKQGGSTELQVDDLIDEIEGKIADVVSANQGNSTWTLLRYSGAPSEPLPGRDLDGTPYIVEIIHLEVLNYDD